MYNKKVLILAMHPAPYRNPVFYELLKKYNFDIKFLYGIDKGHTEWGGSETQNTIKYISIPIIGDVHFGLRKMVKNYETILIPGWFPISLMFLLIYCIRHKKKIVFSCDTVSCSKNLFHKYIFNCLSKCDSFFVPGNKTLDFLKNQVGIEPKKIFQGSYMIDETEWNNKVKQLFNTRNSNRKELGIKDDEFILLFVGKFVKNRDIPLLLQSVEDVRIKNRKIRCIIIGNGNFYNENMQMSLKHDENAFLYFEKVSYEELGKFYSIADCYIHPGDEPYSLATVQGVIAELPIISYKNVGCLLDYVEDKKNGIIVNEKSVSKLSNAIMEIYNNRKKYSENAKTSCRYFLNERNVQFAVKQLEKALFIQ